MRLGHLDLYAEEPSRAVDRQLEIYLTRRNVDRVLRDRDARRIGICGSGRRRCEYQDDKKQHKSLDQWIPPALALDSTYAFPKPVASLREGGEMLDPPRLAS